MMEDKLEGTGLPAHGLVFLDVSWVLDLPLSKTGEVVDEFRQHGGVVTVLVKNNLRRASPKHYGNYDGG